MSTSPKNATKMNENFSFQATCWRSKYDAYTINPLGISCKLHDIKMEILMLVFMFYRFVPIKIAFYRVFSRARTICWWYCILSDAIDLGRLQINTIVVSLCTKSINIFISCDDLISSSRTRKSQYIISRICMSNELEIRLLCFTKCLFHLIL